DYYCMIWHNNVVLF
nr:immunoglobulin light chain junction region [Macaca mulatta]MOW01746.1 immunoglobulin light chain junction region [Macaca mulatta]MOW67329.1 immunoglobulin light chain junction region [Macaca mulatta]MOW70755.1 immunoglobulin light chain junction region [Macaca mulatta]